MTSLPYNGKTIGHAQVWTLGLLAWLWLAAQARAAEPLIKLSSGTSAVETETKASTETAKNGEPSSPDRVLPGEPPVRKNYLLPALEIPSFLLLLNLYDRTAYPNSGYNSGIQSSKQNFLHGPWVYDHDPFDINQLGHPLQGAMMYGFARSSGLNFWESLIYSNAGSFLWKISGETDAPSINDLITTGNAGSILGEELYRMGSLVLERGSEGGAKPAAWREWCAAAISPPTGLNRLLFGDRYRWMESRGPATFTRLRIGQSQRASVSDSLAGARETVPQEATADFVMDYGLPGKDGYRYIRPFDYFAFQITGDADRAHPFENIMTRGMLLGSKYELGDDYRGVWGLYGSYDYIAPEQVFRVSSTAGSVGTTAQWWLSQKTALQGTALGGVGFAGAGTTLNAGEGSYHYGATPQTLLALRLILGERVLLESTARQYYVSALGGTQPGSDNIARVDASATLRVWGHHALGVQYVLSHRDAHYAGEPNRHQDVGVVGVFYNLLGDTHLGAVAWDREP